MTETRRPVPAEKEEELPFLSRWSRRKLAQDPDEASESAAVETQVAATQLETDSQAEVDADPIDSRTGKRMSELTDEDMPALETLTPNSDVSMFMAKNVSSALRMKALNKIFTNPKYNVWCVCAEYAEDYNGYLPLGDVVPHDLKQAIVREAGKLYERLAGRGVDVSREELESRVAAQLRGEKMPDIETEFLARAKNAEHASSSVVDPRADTESVGQDAAAPSTARKEAT
ncbi:MAG TPA: DUF3306 domain-containing protein [Azoarcus sp.]|nr:DUF3306 domain-containing protein [Azoarcus sp.]